MPKRVKHANVNSEQKIKLEKEMQTLEKCMEDMKAIFKLNNEKLVFNFRVLREREIVNKAQKTMLRDKLMKI